VTVVGPVRLSGGTVVLDVPWAPADSLRGAARDRAIESALVARVPVIRRSGNALLRRREFSGISIDAPLVRTAIGDTTAIAQWLDAHAYVYTAEDLFAVAQYIERGYSVAAVRVVAGSSITDGALAPLAFTYEGDQAIIPAAIAAQPGRVDPVTAYIAGPGRYEFFGAFVSFAAATRYMGQSFLTRNDMLLELSGSPDSDPRAVRAAFDTATRATVDVTQVVKIPSSKCPIYQAVDAAPMIDAHPSTPPPDPPEEGFCCCRLAERRELHGTMLTVSLFAGALLLVRRRR